MVTNGMCSAAEAKLFKDTYRWLLRVRYEKAFDKPHRISVHCTFCRWVFFKATTDKTTNEEAGRSTEK